MRLYETVRREGTEAQSMTVTGWSILNFPVDVRWMYIGSVPSIEGCARCTREDDDSTAQ